MTPRALRQAPRRPLDLLIGVIVTVVSSSYTAFLAWWLDTFLARSSDAKLKAAIKDQLTSVFHRHGAEWVQNNLDVPMHRSVSISFATATSADFDLKFQLYQDELNAFVRPCNGCDSWTPTWEVLEMRDVNGEPLPAMYLLSNAWDMAEMLERNWARLTASMNAQAQTSQEFSAFDVS
jgi:hypothetical protein